MERLFCFVWGVGELKYDKASLSFGRTSAEIVWCFWGMFHTIETTNMEYLISELALNYINQKKSGIKL